MLAVCADTLFQLKVLALAQVNEVKGFSPEKLHLYPLGTLKLKLDRQQHPQRPNQFGNALSSVQRSEISTPMHMADRTI